MIIIKLNALVVSLFSVYLLFSSTVLFAFNWNGKNATSIFDRLDHEFDLQSGHPLATKNAFVYFKRQLNLEKSKKRMAKDRKIVLSVLGEDPHGDIWGTEKSEVLQQVLFGSWMNEVKVNIDAADNGEDIHVTNEDNDAHHESSNHGWRAWFDPMKVVSKSLAFIYSSYLDNYKHSIRYQLDTKYTSANHLHAMEITSIDHASETSGQKHTFELIEETVSRSIIYSIVNLGIASRAQVDGSLTQDEIKQLRAEAFTLLGSIFHLLEDSTATCSKSTRNFVNECIPGDGHTIYKNIRGRPRVVTLSDNSFFETRHSFHSKLDDLYRPDKLSAAFIVDGFNLDPALMTSKILREVIWGAFSIRQYTSNKNAKDFKKEYPRMHSFELRKKHSRFEYDHWMMTMVGVPKAMKIQKSILDELFAQPKERQPMPRLDTENK